MAFLQNENTNIFIAKHFIMRAYFLNISEEERKSIQEKQRSTYDGYKTMAPKIPSETPLNVENLALDEVILRLECIQHLFSIDRVEACAIMSK